MDLKKFIGNRIKELRKSQGMNQEVLADKLDTTKQTVSRYENGQRQANQDILFQLASIFSVSVDDFFPSINKEEREMELDYFDTNVSAGTPETTEPVTEYNAKKVSIPKHVYEKWKDKDLKCVKLNGESMNNVIPNGSLIGFKPINLANLKNGDIVLFNDDYDYSVKRFYNDKENERFIFKPDSSDMSFTDYIVEYENAGNLIIEGKVVMYLVDLD